MCSSDLVFVAPTFVQERGAALARVVIPSEAKSVTRMTLATRVIIEA